MPFFDGFPGNHKQNHLTVCLNPLRLSLTTALMLFGTQIPAPTDPCRLSPVPYCRWATRQTRLLKLSTFSRHRRCRRCTRLLYAGESIDTVTARELIHVNHRQIGEALVFLKAASRCRSAQFREIASMILAGACWRCITPMAESTWQNQIDALGNGAETDNMEDLMPELGWFILRISLFSKKITKPKIDYL